MKKRYVSMLCAGAMLLSLAACTSKAPTTDDPSGGNQNNEETIVFTIAHVDAETAPSHQMLLEVEKYVEEETNGRVDIQIFPNGTMGGDREVLESIQLGNIQMTNVAGSTLSSYDEKYSIFEVPFLFEDFDALCRAYDGELGEIYNEWLAEDNFECLGILTYGWKGVSNSVRPIRTPDDMKGIKIRVMEVPMFVDTFKALGANPTPMSWNDVYTGLQQGTIQGQDNSPEITYTSNFYEQQKYYTTTNHVQTNGMLLVQKSYFDSLPEDIQSVIREGFDRVIDSQRQRSVEDQDMYLQKMADEGIEVIELTDEERAAFVEKVADVHESVRELVGDEVFEVAMACNE